MKRLVEGVEGIHVARGLGPVLGGEIGLQLLELVGAGTLGGEPDRTALEGLSHERGVRDRVVGDERDEGAELRDDGHQALVAQAGKPLAHGGAADAEELGELVLGEAAAGLELGADDRFAEREVDLIAGRDTARSVGKRDSHVG